MGKILDKFKGKPASVYTGSRPLGEREFVEPVKAQPSILDKLEAEQREDVASFSKLQNEAFRVAQECFTIGNRMGKREGEIAWVRENPHALAILTLLAGKFQR